MDALRIATFNVKDLFVARVPADAPLVEAKLAAMAVEIRRSGAHVVALQEVGAPELLAMLTREHLRELEFGEAVLGTQDRRGIRNAILSRVPVRSSRVHTSDALPFPALVHGDAAPFAGRIPLRRGVVHVRVDAGELGEIDVLTAHFKSNRATPLEGAPGLAAGPPTAHARGEAAVRTVVQRMAEALFVRGLVDDLLATEPDRAVCVLGDLNDTQDSLPVRIVRGDFPPRANLLHACARRLPEERRYSYLKGEERLLIDHVLVSESLDRRARDFAIQNEHLRAHASARVPEGEVPAPSIDSDHALCVVEIGRDAVVA